ncbi:PQQ-binding-like beta-propeller repeat protein [Armatimonas sp.]|uniref:outer membrane protein assembly factor BamB family protein n=1 Tax=Armatimonas sp. TaxID=1872638 RepID=UPI0037527892
MTARIQLHFQKNELQATDRNGKTIWKKRFPDNDVVGVECRGERVFVTLTQGLCCLTQASGKEIWKAPAKGYTRYTGKATIYEDTVMVSFWASGAYLHCRTDAFDATTGKLLWDAVGELKQVTKTRVVLERRFPVLDPTPHELVSHVQLDRRSGKER